MANAQFLRRTKASTRRTILMLALILPLSGCAAIVAGEIAAAVHDNSPSSKQKRIEKQCANEYPNDPHEYFKCVQWRTE